MFTENLVLRNLAILQTLVKGNATLEELAAEAKCAVGSLSGPLRMLREQGLVAEGSGSYSLAEGKKTEEILAMVAPWASYFNASFYDIAKDTAKIILEKSWEEVKVEGVMLFGSTLRRDNPNDIDLLILHSGNKLSPYTRYSEREGKMQYDAPTGKGNVRERSFNLLRYTGYRIDSNERAVAHIGRRIEQLGAGPALSERVQQDIEERGADVVCNDEDIYGIETVFDVQAMSTALLGDAKPLELEARTHAAYGSDENREREYQDYWRYLRKRIAGERQDAVKNCRDPTFWHTILSEGRLYDPARHDFTIPIEEKYPGALALFPAGREE